MKDDKLNMRKLARLPLDERKMILEGEAIIQIVEKAIIDSKEYPTRTQVWRSLSRKMSQQTFKRVLVYLETSGKIAFDKTQIIYTGANNPKLKKLIETSVPIVFPGQFAELKGRSKKITKDPIKVFHESVRKNYGVLKGLNNGSKKKGRRDRR